MEMLRQQSLTMQQNQQMCAAMLRRMDLEEKRRNEADEKAAETARIAAEAALKAKTSDPFVPTPSASTSSPSALTGSASYTPVLLRTGQKSICLPCRSSIILMQDEAYVRELQFCIKTKHELDQF